MRKLIVVAGGLAAVAVLALIVLSKGSQIRIDPPLKAVGMESPVRVVIDSPQGIRRVRAFIEQNGVRHQVFAKSWPSRYLVFSSRNLPPQDVVFQAGRKQAAALKDGPARLLVEAQANNFLGRSSSVSQDITVVTQPPRVAADTFQHYINQGGAELVVFTPSGYWTEAGVKVGNYRFRSYPLPGSPRGERFSLFVFPWDAPAGAVPVVYAGNPTGAEATAQFTYKLFPKKFRSRDLPVDDRFFDKVVNQIDPGGAGDLLSRFLKINGEFRRRDNQRLADLRLKTEERFLWSGPFLQLANSKVESLFADRRSYIYNGKKVDEQVHLGFDLSVTQGIPVTAANSGKVIHAGDLGIYGNCIVLDHGYGLQSIYAHLSRIDVKPDDMVKRGQEMGRSGATGLAGGDHLHFSMQIDGVQTNAVEWWDDHWIQDRIRSKVPLPAQ